MPYTEEDEDRMLMQAILESLKDLDKSNSKDTKTVASDAVSEESSVAKDGNHTTDVATLETDASSIYVSATDVPAKDVAICNSVAKKADVQSADRSAATDAAVSVNAAGASESNGSTQAVNGKSGPAESQKSKQNSSGEDGTRATLVVQKSRTGSLMDGLSQKWGSFFKNND
ncbi:uncharacterized protein LOC124682005 [Lolium rigidum]|uniref:uncharacterized protein LOC124682005 n=1 Tax=Lolium rigidum TaxID=89674 RepID=UPI001F5CFF46|nr:uncharacterized protein LOC124682005 [Lolium rigidum]